jgi:hypothetical protein
VYVNVRLEGLFTKPGVADRLLNVEVPMRIRMAFLVLSYVPYAIIQGCGGDSGVNIDASTDGTVSDSPNMGNDASNDVAQQNDTGMGNDTGTGSDASDASMESGSTGILSWGCGNATVSSCALCIGHTQPCVYCETKDASVLAGNCVQEGTSCFMGAPMGYGNCPCPGNDAGGCPEPYQVCFAFMGGQCGTCGEIPETNGLTCENGGKCDSVDGGCL